jgi:intein/homing endonuclease
MTNKSIMDVRKDFPILKRKINGKPLIYLDNAATTQKPRQVLDAVNEFYENHAGNPGRGAHALAREATDAYEDARKKVASFINAKPEEIVFTSNATQGLNMVANSYGRDLGKFDEVLTTVMEHHSSYLPWKIISEKTKCKLNLVDITDDHKLDMRDYEKKLSKSTVFVAATHVSNVFGGVNPVEKMAKMAHEKGAKFVLDGSQSVPHMEIDVKKLDCDFMAFSVTGDTPILVSFDDEINLLPIRKVIELLKEGERGRVLSLNKRGQVVFEEITGHLSHKDKIFQIKYENCAIPVKATGYHSLYVWKNGDIEERRVDELSIGDYLITFNQISDNIVKKDKLVEYSYKHHGNHIKEKVVITPEIMRLIGYYLAEGCLGNNFKTQLTFNKNENEYIDDCGKLIELLTGTSFYNDSFDKVQTLRNKSPSEISRITGLDREAIKKYGGLSKRCRGVFKPSIKQMRADVRVTGSRCDIRFYSRKWFEFFNQFCGRGNKKHLPGFIWTMPKKHILELLRGYLRGDASKNEKYRLRVKSVAKDIITELCWVLKLNGISNTVERIPAKKGLQELYCLVIQRSELGELKEFRSKTVKEDSPKAKLLPVDALRTVFKEPKPHYN